MIYFIIGIAVAALIILPLVKFDYEVEKADVADKDLIEFAIAINGHHVTIFSNRWFKRKR